MSQILERLSAMRTRRFATIDVPFVGESRIRSLTAREMRDIRERWSSQDGKAEANALKLRQYLMAACLVDEVGNTPYSLDDVDAGRLDDIDGAIVDAIYGAAVQHTGFGQIATFIDVEAAAKN